jgi:hypothetical protein
MTHKFEAMRLQLAAQPAVGRQAPNWAWVALFRENLISLNDNLQIGSSGVH